MAQFFGSGVQRPLNRASVACAGATRSGLQQPDAEAQGRPIQTNVVLVSARPSIFDVSQVIVDHFFFLPLRPIDARRGLSLGDA
jgi:hypothetical protein